MKKSFSAPYRPEPTGAAFSLHALVRVTSFFPHGVPLAFVAASPMARIASETYRAEESFRWSEEGLVVKEPGEKESIATYEAREVRRAGVQLGDIIIQYHDALGHVERHHTDVREHSATTVKSMWEQRQQEERRAQDGGHAERVEVEDFCLQRSSPEETPFEVVEGGGWMKEERIASGGLLLSQPDSFSKAAFSSERSKTEPRSVFYLPGPSHRRLYIRVHPPVPEETEAYRKKVEEAAKKKYEWEEDEAFTASSSPAPAPVELKDYPPSMHQRNLLPPKVDHRELTLGEVLAHSLWWLHRPSVSTCRYLEEDPYAAESCFRPPPPPSLHLHLYTHKPTDAPELLDVLLPPFPVVTAPSQQLPEEGSAEASAKSSDERRQLLAILGGRRPHAAREERKAEALVTATAATHSSSASASSSPSPRLKHHVKDAELETLILVGYPFMSLHLTEATAVPISPRHLGHLKLLKLSGVVVTDEGIRTTLSLNVPQPRLTIRENRALLAAQHSSGGDDAEPLFPPLSQLQAADFGFCMSLTCLPLLTPSPPQALQLAVTPLRYLHSLSLQATGLCDGMVPLLVAGCPTVRELLLGCCEHLTTIAPLGMLSKLRLLDVHGTNLCDSGLAAAFRSSEQSEDAQGGVGQLEVCAVGSGSTPSPNSLTISFPNKRRVLFPSLEELNLSGCSRVSDISPLRNLCLSLLRLDLRHTPVKSGLAYLPECTRLQELRLQTDLSYPGQQQPPDLTSFGWFPSCFTFVRLYLHTTPCLTGESLTGLTSCPLKQLTIIEAPLLTSLKALAAIPTLQVLFVSRTGLTDDGLQDLIPATQQRLECMRLEKVTLHHCHSLHELAPLSVLPQLQHLDVRQNSALDNHSFKAFSRSRQPLKVLLASQYAALTQLGMLADLPQLEWLDVQQCGLRDEGLEMLVSSRSAISSLFISYCTHLSQVGWLSVLPRLHTLDLSGTRVTESAVAQLSAARQLRVLLLVNCPGLQFTAKASPEAPFRKVSVLSLAHNPQLTTKGLRLLMHLSLDSEVRATNPLQSSFPALRELNLSHTAVDSIEPLLTSYQLESLEASSTPLHIEGLQLLHELCSLRRLTLQNVGAIGGGLTTLLSHRRLEYVDVRGAALVSSSPDQPIELPLSLLSSPKLVELAVDEHQLPILLPLLQNHKSIPRLQRLRVRAHRAEEVEHDTADAARRAIAVARPILTVHWEDEKLVE